MKLRVTIKNQMSLQQSTFKHMKSWNSLKNTILVAYHGADFSLASFLDL